METTGNFGCLNSETCSHSIPTLISFHTSKISWTNWYLSPRIHIVAPPSSIRRPPLPLAQRSGTISVYGNSCMVGKSKMHCHSICMQNESVSPITKISSSERFLMGLMCLISSALCLKSTTIFFNFSLILGHKRLLHKRFFSINHQRSTFVRFDTPTV